MQFGAISGWLRYNPRHKICLVYLLRKMPFPQPIPFGDWQDYNSAHETCSLLSSVVWCRRCHCSGQAGSEAFAIRFPVALDPVGTTRTKICKEGIWLKTQERSLKLYKDVGSAFQLKTENLRRS